MKNEPLSAMASCVVFLLVACSGSETRKPSPEEQLDAEELPASPRSKTPPAEAEEEPRGNACNADSDCATNLCVANECCSRSPAGTKSTGAVSGTVKVCCEGTAVVTAVEDCGNGQNHSAVKVSAQCAEAHEGPMNGGSACAQISCAQSTCKE
jgi:hypothetical protein